MPEFNPSSDLAGADTPQPPRQPERRPERIATVVGLLLGILLLYFYRCTFLGEFLSPAAILKSWAPWTGAVHGGSFNGLRSDDVFLAFPLYASHFEAMRHGQIPFWDPWKLGGNLGGMSWVSLGQLLYPPAWVFMLGKPGAMQVAFAIIRLLIGGLGTVALMRQLGVSRAGARLAGISFMLTGSNIVWLSSPVTSVMVFLPWALLALESWLIRPSRIAFAGLALAVGSQFLAGYVAQSFVFGVTLALYGGIRAALAWKDLGTRQVVLRMLGWIVAGVAGLAIGALGILPSLASLQSSGMSARTAGLGSLPGIVLLQYLNPDFFGNPVRGMWWYGSNYCELIAYVGLLPLFLALGALVGIRGDRRLVPFLVPLALFTAFIYGVPGVHELGRLPGFSQTALTRWTAPMAFLLTCLAGFGWDRLTAHPRRMLMGWLGFLAGAISLLIVGFHHVWPDLVRLDITRQALESNGILLGVMLLATPVMALAARHGTFTRAHAGWLGAILVLDLGFFGAGFNPTAERSTFYAETPGIARLMADRDQGRILAYESLLMGDTASMYGLHGLTGYDIKQDHAIRRFLYEAGDRSLHPSQTVTANAFIQATTGHGHAAVNDLTLNVSPESPLLDLAAVRHLVMPPDDSHSNLGPFVHSGPDCLIRDNPHARPWAWWTPVARVVSDDEAYDRMRSAPRGGPTEALLAEAPSASFSLDNPGTGSVRVLERGIGHMRLSVEGGSAGFIIVSDRHDPGWRVTIDNTPAPLLRADAILGAIAVPAGDHIVALRFAPPLAVGSFWVSLSGLLLAFAVIIHSLLRTLSVREVAITNGGHHPDLTEPG